MKLAKTKEITKNCISTWKLNNTLLNNQWVTEEIKDEINQCLQCNSNADTTDRMYGKQGKQPSEGAL